jgi:hypothetical protein
MTIEKNTESKKLEGEVCAMVREKKFFLKFEKKVSEVLMKVAIFNEWENLKKELEK